MTAKVTLVDYGMGNLWSVANAFKFLGAECIISGNPKDIIAAEQLLLPGVGSFRKAMQVLESSGLAEALQEAVSVRQRKILGICLGMQLLAEAGSEDGDSSGLGFIPGRVERFSGEAMAGLKVPHIGFNRVEAPSASRLFSGLSPAADFYFVHSFHLPHGKLSHGQMAKCCYGVEFAAAYENGNVFATQFHPEKSQTNGLQLLKNFLAA